MNNTELYNQYDLLLPSKFEGGYLIISLYEKIQNEEIEEYFTANDITAILKEISIRFEQESTPNWNRLKDNLFQYFLRNHPDEAWKYYLTDYAKSMVELMRNKLENPYKNHPLEKSFKEFFYINNNQTHTIDEIERRFGRIFIQGPKKIIMDHLESLEDELRYAYKELNEILRDENEDASTLVKQFTTVFKTFGSRAEDITNAIITKDRFLSDLLRIVDHFYSKVENETEQPETSVLNTTNWEKARDIFNDIRVFFNNVEIKVALIRRQINNASEKLSELQEQFSSKSHFRLQVKKLFEIALSTATYYEDDVIFNNNFPLKKLPFEVTKILYPKHYDFGDDTPNQVVTIEIDETYENQEREKIGKEIQAQQLVNKLVAQYIERIKNGDVLPIAEIIEKETSEKGFEIAIQIASELIANVSENPQININVRQELLNSKSQDLHLWKTEITA